MKVPYIQDVLQQKPDFSTVNNAITSQNCYYIYHTMWLTICWILQVSQVTFLDFIIVTAPVQRNNTWAMAWQNQQSDCAPSEDSDQLGHLPSLIRVFGVRMKKAWGLSYPLSAQRRLWSDWVDAQADLSLIRLGGCPGWSESSLGAKSFVGFVMSWLTLFWFLHYYLKYFKLSYCEDNIKHSIHKIGVTALLTEFTDHTSYSVFGCSNSFVVIIL